MNNSHAAMASNMTNEKTIIQKYHSIWLKIKSFFHGNPPAIIGSLILSIILIGAIFAPFLSTHNPDKRVARPHLAPSSEHYLGTTRNGRDVYSQVLQGARKTLSVALFAGVISTLIAVSVGITAGYFGGRIDNWLNFFTNVFLVFPQFPLLIVLAAFFGQISSAVIAILLGITSWPWGARVIRSQTMAIRNKEFIISAEVMGESKLRILFIEILPNLISIVFGGFLGAFSYAMGAEAGLSFLGLGDATEVTWGAMLYWAQVSSSLYTGAWWEMLVPAIALALTGGALALINMSIDQISNPKLKTGPHMKLWKKLNKEADHRRGLV